MLYDEELDLFRGSAPDKMTGQQPLLTTKLDSAHHQANHCLSTALDTLAIK